MRNKLKIFTFFSLSLLSLAVIAYLAQLLSKSFDLKELTHETGVLGPIFLTLGIALSGIFVPLTSLPFLLAGLAIYGFWQTFIIFYLGNTIIAPVVDFWIARRFGRPVVTKLAGKKSLEKIDQISGIIGIKILVLLRIFGGVLFDTVSYAAGLSNINFKIYFITTSILPLPGMAVTLYLLNKGLNTSYLYFVVIIFWGYLAGIITINFTLKRKKIYHG